MSNINLADIYHLNHTMPAPIADAIELSEHGLEGWIIEKSNKLNSEELSKIEKNAINYAIRYEFYQRELNQFLEHFPGAIAIKGMSLIPRLYKNPVLRRVTDVDLFYPYDLTEVENYLKSKGFVLDENKWEANCFKLSATKVIDGVEVPLEIHQELLWKNDFDWKIINKTLAPEDELIYLCGHLAYQHTMLHINWLFDIALLIKENPNWDIQRLKKILSKTQLKTSLSACLWSVQAHLKQELPDSLQEFVTKSFRMRFIKFFMTSNFLWKPKKHLISYYALKFLLKDDFLNPILYTFLWVKHRIKA